MRIGVDTGGTFTDCVVVVGSEVHALKVFSTAQDAARGILEGVRRIASIERQKGERPASLDILHGTTVGTNSLLERRGARVALVTTAGFEDLIEIGRQHRPRLYDLNVRREPSLAPRDLRWGVRERTAADGRILLRPSSKELRRVSLAIAHSGAESVAVCFLFSFRNPENERAAARALAKLGLPVSISHEILPEFREYERLSTVVINAYLAPRLGTYLQRLEQALRTESPSTTRRPRPARVFVMQSSGGITTAARAAREPVHTILSGPAGGVVAAWRLARQLGLARVISFDMGGTSTDVCLMNGAPRTTNETTLAGQPVAVPVLDVHSVGAGGGSIARLDAGGALRVGPESAGAEPGPACYDRGGTQPTVTDANLLLGRLDAEYFLGGTHRLNVAAAEKAFDDFLACLGARRHSAAFKNRFDLAQGILAVSNASMERALRVISVERGYDPRDFALISFGGAGGLHAADLARALGLRGVVVPRNPGAFSALGILLSDIVQDVSQSVLLPVPEVAHKKAFFKTLGVRFAPLERAARAQFAREHGTARGILAERRLDVRYVGQAYEITVPFTKDFAARFHAEHEKAYGYAHAARPLEVVNLRLRLTLPTPRPRRQAHAVRARDAKPAVIKRKPVWFAGNFQSTPIYHRERLAAGMRLRGPAVIVEYSGTTAVPPDFICRVDEYLNLRLEHHAR